MWATRPQTLTPCLPLKRGPQGLFSRNIVAENVWASFSIPFASHDDIGQWKIEVRDEASGVKSTSAVTVK